MGIYKKGLEKAEAFYDWRRRVWKAKNEYGVPAATKMKYALRGFTPNEVVWFDLENNDYREYISDNERLRSREINGIYKTILDDKLLFEEIFRHHVRVPRIYAWISEGEVFGLHGTEVDTRTFIRFLRKIGAAVLKWENGYEGKGTYVLFAKEDGDFLVNGETMDAKAVRRLLRGKGSSILCEYMRQGAFADSLYPEAVNTLRIVCAKKKGERHVHILGAVQRVGNEKSRPVDNVSAGAISCRVDLETGTLGKGVVAKSSHKGEGVTYFETHPDTGARLEGRVIPGWEKIKEEILALTDSFPYLGLVAWDVLLTDEGICVIEGNASAGCVMFQMDGGVRGGEIGEIYRSYGIIR